MLRQRCRPSSYRSLSCKADRSAFLSVPSAVTIARRALLAAGVLGSAASFRFGLPRRSPLSADGMNDSVRRCNFKFATTVSSESCLRRGTTTRAAADLGFRGRCLRRITQVIHYYPPNSKCSSPLLLLLLLLRHRRTNFSPR